MKKHLVAMLIAVLAVLTLTACSKQTEQISEDIGDPVPMEYILSNTDLTAEDFEGVDYEAFMNEMGYGTENIDEHLRLVPRLLAFYKEDMEKERLYGPDIDYSVIYYQAEGTLKEEDLDNIEVIICNDYDGDLSRTVVIDLTTDKVYAGIGDFISRCNDSCVTAKVTQGDREWLSDTISDSGITSWKRRYKGTNACTTGYAGTSIAFRLNDGRCVSYSSSGVRFSGMPAEMSILCRDIMNRFPEDYN
ncbi:MAG: hypothetical protein E7559_04700 [Ruminococcaceae bacterium]|nr:hypothetical protein [Oscillospiraceae bacterium]